MTDRIASLHLLVNCQAASGEQPSDQVGDHVGAEALADFAERYQDNPLVMDKWFSLQALQHHLPVEKLQVLMQHPAFSIKNPNKVRAVIGAFAHANATGFHAADGQGYEFVGQQIIEMNQLNPQVAARLASSFNRWRSYPEDRQQLMQAQLQRIAAVKSLSPDVFEVVNNALNKA